MSIGSSQGPARAEWCPSCGMTLAREAATCGVCGRAVASPGVASAPGLVSATEAAIAQPATMPAVVPVVVPVVAAALAGAAKSAVSGEAPDIVATPPPSLESAPPASVAEPAVAPPTWHGDAAQVSPAAVESTPPHVSPAPSVDWAPPPPPMPAVDWTAGAPTSPGGIAALATSPVASAPARRTRRAGLIAGIAAVCLVAILGGSAYWIFASFLSAANQSAAARYLPENTEYYTSVDLIAAATNSHHVSRGDLGKASGASDPLKQGIGLDWQNDVLPWVGRSITIAAFPVVPGGSGGYAGILPFDGVLLIDSRDDAAAQRAIQKALAFQQENGVTFSTSSYGGYTLHVTNGVGKASVIAMGPGLVLLTTGLDAAHTVIDRANGHGTTLAGSTGFQHATGDLPANRFGTMYLNLRALSSLTESGVGIPRIPFLETYPTAGGALLWTQSGLRWQAAFKPAHAGVPRRALSGDTTGLASLVPEHVTLYSGIANTGQLVEELARVVTPAGASSSTSVDDALQQSFGVAPSDPVLQQPAAYVTLPTTVGDHGVTPPSAFLLRAPDASAATALLARVAQRQHMTMKATTVDGVSATAFYTTVDNMYRAAPGISLFPPGADAAPVRPSLAATDTRLAGVAATVDGTLVIASTSESLTTIIETAHGNQANLGQSAAFRQLVARAPSGAASTVYLDLSGLRQLYSPPVVGGSDTLALHVTETLFTLVWDHTGFQGTYDVSLNQ